MYGPLIIGLSGLSLTDEEQGIITNKLVVGVVLFAHNFESFHQLKSLISSLQDVRAKHQLPPVIVALDHEGGRVQRLKGENFTCLPSADLIGKTYQSDIDYALELIEHIATLTAVELGRVGVSLVLGPCLDLQSVNKTFLSDRSYSQDYREVSNLAKRFLIIMSRYQLTAVGKHFPGLGANSSDTHTHFPVIKTTFAELKDKHLKPYASLIEAGLLRVLMLSHGAYISKDVKPMPASDKWIDGVLRKELGFDGLVITDCLQMAGAIPLGKHLFSRVLSCLNAGCDFVLLTHVSRSIMKTLEKEFGKQEGVAALNALAKRQKSEVIKNIIKHDINYYERLYHTSATKQAKAEVDQFMQLQTDASGVPKNARLSAFLTAKRMLKRIIKKPSKANLPLWSVITYMHSKKIKKITKQSLDEKMS